MGKQINVKFVDFYSGFKANDTVYYHWLVEHGYNVVLSEQPDYLFFSVFGEEHLKYNDCVKIFCTGECQTPDFNLCDYALGFDYLDFGDRYLRFPLYMTYNRPAFDRMLHKHEQTEADLAKKSGFCSFVYSNGRAAEQRTKFFHALDKRRHVDSGGKLLNNIGGPVADKIEFQKKYRFAIAFENTTYPGYSTEKIVEAFASGCIPIYYGDPEIGRVFNPGSFVNCHDFNSMDEVIARVLEIDSDPALYRQYVKALPLLDMQLREKTMDALDAFLGNIFEQEKEAAKRYSRTYWGVRLVSERRRQIQAYHRSLRYCLSYVYMQTIYPIARKNERLWKWTQSLMRIFG